jgi:hypothetical protein
MPARPSAFFDIHPDPGEGLGARLGDLKVSASAAGEPVGRTHVVQERHAERAGDMVVAQPGAAQRAVGDGLQQRPHRRGRADPGERLERLGDLGAG